MSIFLNIQRNFLSIKPIFFLFCMLGMLCFIKNPVFAVCSDNYTKTCIDYCGIPAEPRLTVCCPTNPLLCDTVTDFWSFESSGCKDPNQITPGCREYSQIMYIEGCGYFSFKYHQMLCYPNNSPTPLITECNLPTNGCKDCMCNLNAQDINGGLVVGGCTEQDVCPVSGGGGQTPMCQIQNLTCPATCTIGQNFNVSYEYRNTSYATKPYFSQRIEGSNPWGSYTQLWCLADQTVNDDQWHTVTQSIACSNNFTGTIRVGAHSNAGHWIDWCDYGWENAQIGCSASCSVQPVQPIPPAIGYVNIKHPLGILKLRLISFANALSALKGIIKVARFAGDTNAAADLVEPTDPNASPVRVMTPYGIKAWRREP